MDSRTARTLRRVAAALVFATAAFHLWWGVPRSIIYLQALGSYAGGVVPDPRPFLFVGLGVALLAGPYLVRFDVVSLRQAYVGGVVLLLASVAAWVFWHATGHGAFLASGFEAPATAGSDGGHSHGGNTAVLILDHFNTEPLEAAIKTIELAAAASFAALLRTDPALATQESTEQSSVDEN